MKKLLKLTKINLLTFFDIHKVINPVSKKEKKKAIWMLLLYILSFGLLAFTFFSASRFMLSGLILMEIPHILLVLFMAASSILSVMSSVSKVNKTIFNSDDYNILLSLPIKKSTIISSKIILLYISNLVFTLLLMFPAYLAYILKVDVALSFHFYYLITLFLIPVVPTVIGSIIGSLLSSITSRFKYKNFVNVFLNLVLFLGVYALSYRVQSLTTIDLANLSDSFVSKINNIYPLSKMYLNIIQNESLYNFILFVLISIIIYELFKYSLVKYFDNINSKLSAVTIVNEYKDSDVKQNSKLISLYKKELKRYFSSPLYVLNTALGCVILIIALIVFAIYGSESLDALLDIPNLSNYLILYGPLVFCAFCALSCTTNSSISLEGKNIWILKSLPVTVKEIFLSKIMVNLTILYPTILIGSILITYIANLTFINFLLLLFVPGIFSLFISGTGILTNLYFPDFEWKNEVKPIKQSISVVVSLAIGFALSLIPIFIKLNINNMLYSFIYGLFLILITYILYRILFTKGKKLFKSL